MINVTKSGGGFFLDRHNFCIADSALPAANPVPLPLAGWLLLSGLAGPDAAAWSKVPLLTLRGAPGFRHARPARIGPDPNQDWPKPRRAGRLA